MRDIDWSAIPFDDLPPWHLDWDVDQRENATYPATTSITAMRPVKPKKYQATDLISPQSYWRRIYRKQRHACT